MIRSTTILLPLLILSALALLTYWVNISVQPPAEKSDGSTRHDPDYMMHNFVSSQTDVKGALRYRLKSAEMKHFPDDDSTHLIKPIYTQYIEGKSYIKVEGLVGDLSSNGKDIKLYKNVKITRAPYAEKQEMTLETEYLNILPDEDLVLTQEPVVIRQAPKTVVYANGMVYEKKKLTLTLLNKVRAHYEKPVMKSARINTLEDESKQNTQGDITHLQQKAALPENLPAPEMSRSKNEQQQIEMKQNAPQQKTRIRRRYEK